MPTSVDVHAHAVVPAAAALLADEPGLASARAVDLISGGAASAQVNGEQMRRIAGQLADPARRLADLDAMGLSVQVVSPHPDHYYWMSAELAQTYSRMVNEGIAAHCATAPDRLAGLATVPLRHPELAVRVLTEAVGEFGLLGAEIGSHIDGGSLAAPELEPFWSCVEELDVALFLHPWACTLGARLSVGYLVNSVGNPAETAVALGQLILGGVLDRHPRLRLLAAHGGGFFPLGIARLDHAWHARPDAHTSQLPPSDYLRRMWFDSLVYTGQAVRRLIDVTGPDRVAIGTDYPFDMGEEHPLERLADAGLSDEDNIAVCAGNARAIFGPRLPG